MLEKISNILNIINFVFIGYYFSFLLTAKIPQSPPIISEKNKSLKKLKLIEKVPPSKLKTKKAKIV